MSANLISDLALSMSGEPVGLTGAFEDEDLPDADGWEEARSFEEVREEITLSHGGNWTTVNPLVELIA